MTTDLDPKALCAELIIIYERYLENPGDEDNNDNALSLYSKYFVTPSFIDQRLARALECTVGVGFQAASPLNSGLVNELLAGLRSLSEELRE